MLVYGIHGAVVLFVIFRAKVVLRTKILHKLKDLTVYDSYSANLWHENSPFLSQFIRIYNRSCLNTLPKPTKTHRREGSHSRRESECVCVSEGVWGSKGASQIEEEERERGGREKGVSLDQVIEY